MPCHARLVHLIVLATVAMAGCGSDPSPPRTEPSPTSAGVRQAEATQAAAQARVAKLRRRKHALEATRTTHVDGTDSLPAGSTAIDDDGEDSHDPTSGHEAATRDDFERLAALLPGKEGVAITAGSKVIAVGGLRSGAAWSTSKAAVAMAAIVAGTARSVDLTQAITASDNASAERLWAGLGSPQQAGAAATAQLRASGDARTAIQADRLLPAYTAFGQTEWSIADQARFALGMKCTPAGRRVLALMGQVVPAQKWGLGSVGLPARMKGGWGPGLTPGAGDGWMDRQFGTLKVNGQMYGVALASSAPDHASGTAALSQLARWAAEHAPSVRGTPAC